GIGTASITGRKFHDLNGNGVRNFGEPFLSGWVMYLDLDDSGTPDPGEPTATTNAQGRYTFSGLGPGTYRVREIQQPGWIQTTAAPPDVAVVQGQVGQGGDFGNFRAATISGKKFNDLNGNGVQDAGEPGLQNWLIYQDLNNNGIFDGGFAGT